MLFVSRRISRSAHTRAKRSKGSSRLRCPSSLKFRGWPDPSPHRGPKEFFSQWSHSRSFSTARQFFAARLRKSAKRAANQFA